MDSIAASRESECEVLQTQMAVWEESKAGDQDDLEAIGGIDLHDPDDAFKMLLAKVSYFVYSMYTSTLILTKFYFTSQGVINSSIKLLFVAVTETDSS